MKFVIRHEIRGKVRIHFHQKDMSIRQADLLHYYLYTLPGVKNARIRERIADVAVVYEGSRRCILEGIQRFSYDSERMEELMPKNSGRALNRKYKEKLVRKAVIGALAKSSLPASVRAVYTAAHSIRCLLQGARCLLRGKLEVEVSDAAATVVSVLKRDFDTAGSITSLLGIGELLEEWIRKKLVGSLAKSMSLNVSRVWQNVDGTEILVPVSRIREGDLVAVHMGNVTPLDGVAVSGNTTVNQASMTGESVPVRKEEGSYVYAETVVEEGEITLRVRTAAGDAGSERIVTMTEESEQLKSTAGGKAATLADVPVPWSLGGTILTWLLTCNVTKALSILMVDFSCALKLAMPLPVLSAIREAGSCHITIKGGRYMGATAAADTIIFGKTEILTKARPQVAGVVVLNDMRKEELLCIAACLEGHLPYSMVKVVVNEVAKRGLVHKETHSRVDYIVAHGIATYVRDERVVIGSYHFASEDEGRRIPEDKRMVFDSLPVEYSHLHLAIGGSLAAVICIKDPLRDEADTVIVALHRQGIIKTVMMTGDSEHTVATVAGRVGVDKYYSEVFLEDKARFVDKEKRKGRKVTMIGDRINDSPALSAVDAGTAISEGVEITREITDITISEDSLFQLVTLRAISRTFMDRIDRNYRFVIGFNPGFTLLGMGGVITSTASAMFHNTSTLAISLKSMTSLLD